MDAAKTFAPVALNGLIVLGCIVARRALVWVGVRPRTHGGNEMLLQLRFKAWYATELIELKRMSNACFRIGFEKAFEDRSNMAVWGAPGIGIAAPLGSASAGCIMDILWMEFAHSVTMRVQATHDGTITVIL